MNFSMNDNDCILCMKPPLRCPLSGGLYADGGQCSATPK